MVQYDTEKGEKVGGKYSNILNYILCMYTTSQQYHIRLHVIKTAVFLMHCKVQAKLLNSFLRIVHVYNF